MGNSSNQKFNNFFKPRDNENHNYHSNPLFGIGDIRAKMVFFDKYLNPQNYNGDTQTKRNNDQDIGIECFGCWLDNLHLEKYQEQIKKYMEMYPFYSEKLSEVSTNLMILDKSIKLNYNVLKINKSIDLDAKVKETLTIQITNIIGSLNKILFPLYKKEALERVSIGEGIDMLDPKTDLVGLKEYEIEFMINEIVTDKNNIGWFDKTENKVYKAAESTISRCTYLLFAVAPPFIFLLGYYWLMYSDYINSDLLFPKISHYILDRPIEFFIYYFAGIVGLFIHFGTIIVKNGRSFININSFLMWFSSRWYSFLSTTIVFCLVFLYFVNVDQASLENSIILGISIDSFSGIFTNRYDIFINESTKSLSSKIN